MTAPLTQSEIPVVTAMEHAEPSRSPWRLGMRRFWKNGAAVAGLVVLVGLVAACFATLPWTTGSVSRGDKAVVRYDDQMELQHVREAPNGQFWMGTDGLGRDLLVRFLLGGAISLSIGVASALIAIFIGTTVGMVAGYRGGRVDAVLMRAVDLLYGLPYILLVILMRVALVPWMQWLLMGEFMKPKEPAFAAGWKPWIEAPAAAQWANMLVLLLGIGSVSWLTLARVVRGQVMSLRDQPFVEAARAMGYPGKRILTRHILPNLLGTIIVYGTLTVPAAILSESFLSFLGLGIQAPLPSWGNLASDGTEALNPVHVRWWLITWPCVGLSVALLCLNFVGDGIRDALDPKA